VLALDGGETTDTAPDVDADHLVVPGVDLQAGVRQGEVGGGDRELDEAVHLLDFLLLHPVERIEALHLAGEPRRMLRSVEQRDGAGARSAGQEGLPGLLRADADRGHEPHARHYDPALCHCDLVLPKPAERGGPTSWPCPRACRCIRWLP